MTSRPRLPSAGLSYDLTALTGSSPIPSKEYPYRGSTALHPAFSQQQRSSVVSSVVVHSAVAPSVGVSSLINSARVIIPSPVLTVSTSSDITDYEWTRIPFSGRLEEPSATASSTNTHRTPDSLQDTERGLSNTNNLDDGNSAASAEEWNKFLNALVDVLSDQQRTRVHQALHRLRSVRSGKIANVQVFLESHH